MAQMEKITIIITLHCLVRNYTTLFFLEKEKEKTTPWFPKPWSTPFITKFSIDIFFFVINNHKCSFWYHKTRRTIYVIDIVGRTSGGSGSVVKWWFWCGHPWSNTQDDIGETFVVWVGGLGRFGKMSFFRIPDDMNKQLSFFNGGHHWSFE